MITQEFINHEAKQEAAAFMSKMLCSDYIEQLTEKKATKLKAEKSQAIVTKDSLKKMLENPNPAYVEAVIGRALVTLFKLQTESEKNTEQTSELNGVGFAGYDAHSGSISAKYYMRTGRLQPFTIESWTKPAKNGYPRLCKYHKQLNAVAMSKTTHYN
jgi:hypothetical protein